MKWFEHKPDAEVRAYAFGESHKNIQPVDFRTLHASAGSVANEQDVITPWTPRHAPEPPTAVETPVASDEPAVADLAAHQEPGATEAEQAPGGGMDAAAFDEAVQARAAEVAHHELEERWESVAGELARWEKQTSATWADQVATVAAAVAQHLVGEALANDPGRIVRAVQHGLRAVDGLGPATVRVHPQAESAVRSALERTASPVREVVADLTVPMGGCRISTERGGAEVDITERARHLAEAAARALAASEAPANADQEFHQPMKMTGTAEPLR